MRECGISFKEISVVIQGSVDIKKTTKCIKSIRCCLPGAVVVLSTWKGENVDGLDYDQVIFNDDPGAFRCKRDDSSRLCNINRQIVSTLAGLKCVRTKYAVKMRSDFCLNGNGFLDYFCKFTSCNIDKGFKHPVITSEWFTRNPRMWTYRLRRAFHPSDIFLFGYTEDLIKLFDTELYPKEYQVYNTECPENINIYRYDPEQYIWISFLKRVNYFEKFDIPVSWSVCRSIDVKNTEESFAKNLIILSNKQIGLVALKEGIYNRASVKDNCYTYKEWLELYRYYHLNDKRAYFKYRFRVIFKNLIHLPWYIIYSGAIKINKYVPRKMQSRLSGIKNAIRYIMVGD